MQEKYKNIWESGNTLEDNYLLIIEHLEKQLSQLQQEKEKLVKDLKQFLNEWDEEDYVSKSIKLILSKLKGE